MGCLASSQHLLLLRAHLPTISVIIPPPTAFRPFQTGPAVRPPGPNTATTPHGPGAHLTSTARFKDTAASSPISGVFSLLWTHTHRNNPGEN